MTELVNPANQQPCPICGSTDYVWGVAAPEQQFVAASQPIVDQLVGSISRSNYLLARNCENCGNVQLFTRGPS